MSAVRRAPSIATSVVLAAALLLLSSPLRAEDCNSRLQVEAEYFRETTSGPSLAIVAGDFDEDGRQDVITANENRSLTALFGAGNFLFARRAEILLDQTPTWLEAGDLNSDGNLDLVVTGEAKTVILLGDGHGAFSVGAEYPFAGRHLALGDLDGDGDVDCVLVQSDRLAVLLLQNLSVARTVIIEGLAARAVRLGDFDENGSLDFVAAQSPGFAVWLNDGTGEVGGPTVYKSRCSSGPSMISVAVGDINADGHLDIASIPSPFPNNGCGITQYGRGDGSFYRPTASEDLILENSRGASILEPERSALLVPDHVPRGPNFITMADLAGTGRSVSILLGSDRGSEVMGQRSNGGPKAATVADFNEDGHLDVAVAGSGVCIHPGNGDGSIRKNQTLSYSGSPRDLEFLDLTEDGIPDLVIPALDRDLVIIPRDADGRLLPFLYGPEAYAPHVFLDANGDGHLDLLRSDLRWYPGLGGGAFGDSPTRFFDQPLAALAGGDIDEDGNADLATIVRTGFYSLPGPVRILSGKGDGTFQDHGAIGISADQIHLIDLDLDGHLDLVGEEAGVVRILFGRGSATFDPAMILPSDSGLEGLAYGDIDGDGSTDIAACEQVPARPGVVFLRHGRSFTRVVAGFTLPPNLGDVDGDGRTDIVSAEIRLFLGNGDGTFRPQAGVFAPSGNILVLPGHGHPADIFVARNNEVDNQGNDLTIIPIFGTPNHPPAVNGAHARVERIWPPNHQVVDVEIEGITDPDGDALTTRVLHVTQDESPGKDCGGAEIRDGHLRIRLERDGSGNGRVYEATFIASDECGATSTGHVTICVPHSPGATCVDDGQAFDALACTSSKRGANAQAADAVELAPPVVRGREVTLRYSLDFPSIVSVEVYDVAGRRMSSLGSSVSAAGNHALAWTAPGAGVYFARIASGEWRLTKAIVVAR